MEEPALICENDPLTERGLWQRRLEASELRYRRLFEAARDGILILDAATGAVVDVNPFLCELVGLERAAILGCKIWELGPFKDVPASKVNFRELQANEYIRYDDLPLESANGGKIPVEFVSNVYQVDGKAVIQCNVRDMTTRKRADEAHALLARAAAQTSDSIIITDAAGRIVFVNPAFERITGWSSADALGQNPRILKSGRQGDAFYRGLWVTISGGATWTGTLENLSRDGAVFQETATISPVRDSDGEISHYVALKRDITHQLSLERQLLRAQKMEMIGRFAGGIAHDFNNLLGVITGYGEILRGDLPEPAPMREDVEQILAAASRASRLTRQLLAFGRKQVLQPKDVELNTLVQDLEQMLPRLLGERISFSTVLSAELGMVRADVGQVEQVIMNLVVNSRDAMPDGGSIRISTENREVSADDPSPGAPVPPGSYVVLSVQDTGSGMDSATQARIFEPFYTTKDVASGTGLGLSTVDGIVGQSGGFVVVDSAPGCGSTFSVYLPRVTPVAEPMPAPEKASTQATSGTDTVLLVEDESDLRKLLERILAKSGYTVLAAADADAAQLLLEAHSGPIELLVTDVILPGVRGTELADIAQRLHPQLKVLLVSGFSDEPIGVGGRDAPSRAFLAKPFAPAVFLAAVRDLLDRF